MPGAAEVAELFTVAEAGIHPADEMPFGVAWTDSLERQSFLAYHEDALASWTPGCWDLNLATLLDGRVIGTQALHGREFGATHEVGSGSWLGRAHQGHGFGTEQRAAVLELAFRGLGALAATTGAIWDNRASQRVSENLGYGFTHENEVAPRGEPVRHFNYRLEASAWSPPCAVELEGLEACLALFGATPVPDKAS